MFKLPWTNLHELNLDWILEKIKKIASDEEAQNEKIEELDERLGTAEQDIVDVEILANNKVDRLVDSAEPRPRAYVKKEDTDGSIIVDTDDTPNTIARRKNGGQLAVSEPISDDDALNLKYFNEHSESALNMRDSEGIGAIQTVHRHDKNEFLPLGGIAGQDEITLDDDSLAAADESAVINGYSKIDDGSKLSVAINNKNYITGNASGAFIAGDTNKIDGGSYSAVTGYKNECRAPYCFMTGGENLIDDDCTRDLMTGAQNEITDNVAYSIVSGNNNHGQLSSSAIISGGWNTVIGGSYGVFFGQSNTHQVGTSALVGGKNNSTTGENIAVFGEENEITSGGEPAAQGNKNILIAGYSNTVNGLAVNAALIGAENEIYNTGENPNTQQIAIGSGNSLGDGNNTTAIGRNNTFGSNVYNSQAVGQGIECSASNQTILGQFPVIDDSAKVNIGVGYDSAARKSAILAYNDRVEIPTKLEVYSVGQNTTSIPNNGYVTSNNSKNVLVKLTAMTPSSGSWVSDYPNMFDWTDFNRFATGQSSRYDVHVLPDGGGRQIPIAFEKYSETEIDIYLIGTTTGTVYRYRIKADGTYTTV